MLFVADISSRRERMAGDDEWAGHLLGMMADGDRKARRGRNLLLDAGSGVRGQGVEAASVSTDGSTKGQKKGQEEWW